MIRALVWNVFYIWCTSDVRIFHRWRHKSVGVAYLNNCWAWVKRRVAKFKIFIPAVLEHFHFLNKAWSIRKKLRSVGSGHKRNILISCALVFCRFESRICYPAVDWIGEFCEIWNITPMCLAQFIESIFCRLCNPNRAASGKYQRQYCNGLIYVQNWILIFCSSLSKQLQ